MANTNYFNIHSPEKSYGKTAINDFNEVLHHGIRNGGIAYACAENGRFTENKISFSRSANGDEYRFLGEAPVPECQTEADQYISVNGFREKRSNKTVYCLNTIVLDIDWHDSPVEKWADNLAHVKNCLNTAYNNGKLPVPSLVTFTGRGICVIYSLCDSIPVLKSASVKRGAKSKSKKSVEFFNAVYFGLMNAYDRELMSTGLSVDRKVSDMSRLIRKVGTFNTKAYKATDDLFTSFCRIILSKNKYYTLYELNKYSVNKINLAYYSKNAGFYEKRLYVLNKIVEMYSGEVTGHRNFLIYNYASIVQNIEGMSEDDVFAFNETFSEPLKRSEVISVIKSVSRKVNKDGTTGYKLTNKRLMDEFGLSDSDAKVLGIGERRREKERQEARQKKSLEIAKRNECIIKLFKEGKTYQRIAEAANCSLGTVFNVINSTCHNEHANVFSALSSSVIKTIRNRMACLCGLKSNEPAIGKSNSCLFWSIFKSCTCKVVNISAHESGASESVNPFRLYPYKKLFFNTC